MSKNNTGADTALFWARKADEELAKFFGQAKESPTAEEIRDMLRLNYNTEYDDAVLIQKKYPSFFNYVYRLHRYTYIDHGEKRSPFEETLNDLDALTVVNIWSKNKQIFSFDTDFLDELLNTKTQIMAKDAFDFLPYNTFYIDLSSHSILSDKIGDGLFLNVEKVKEDAKDNEYANHYLVHLCRIRKGYYHCDTLWRENKDAEHEINRDEQMTILTRNALEENPNISFVDGSETLSTGLYNLLVMQILTYLSSIEPDIKEDEVTKRTYRKPDANRSPKNKFSEIQQWGVGNDFGVSYRKWKKEREQSSNDGDGTSRGAGVKKRPHARKAHWSHYWYGSGENKVRRPKWLSATFINASVQSDEGVTVTKVGN